MKVKMITLMAGPGGTRKPGQVCDVPPKEAEELYAEKADAHAAKPVASAPRTADKPHGRRATKKDAGEEPTEGDEPSEEEEPTEGDEPSEEEEPTE